MKISVISHDMSHNCLGRAYVLASLLMPAHDVEIVGPVMGDDIWEPLRNDTTVAYRPLEKASSLRASLAALDGDVLYAVKPKGTSLGWATLARRQRRRPLVADVDDWESGFFIDSPKWALRNLATVWDPSNVYATLALEGVARRADAVTVSSTWLQRAFGGVIVPHARDADVLDPARHDGLAVREELGLTDKTIVLFMGSPRRHKGIDAVLAAMDAIADPSLAFLVVGADTALPERDYLVTLPRQPFAALPRFLAAADVVVLAQQATHATKAQVPAKVFDAMAMAKPVIATSVSDLPLILDGCGRLTPPGDVDALAGAIRELTADPVRSRALGAAARNKFVKEYSFNAVRPRLVQLMGRFAREVVSA